MKSIKKIKESKFPKIKNKVNTKENKKIETDWIILPQALLKNPNW